MHNVMECLEVDSINISKNLTMSMKHIAETIFVVKEKVKCLLTSDMNL